MRLLLFGALFLPAFICAQIASFPYRESFDTIIPPVLPSGWTTSKNKNASGDFTTSTTTVRSAPHCASSTDATKSQSLTSPYCSFVGKFVDSLEFYERRTSTHTSGLLIEASIGNDPFFSITPGDTLKLVNSTSYVRRIIPLPSLLDNKDSVRFRWRVTGNGSGTTGVIRFDDIVLTVKKAVDLSVTSVSAFPSSPKKGESVSLTIGVRNRALAGNFSGTILLYDSLTVIASQNFNRTLAANESVSVLLHYPNISAGRHPLTVTLSVAGDEDTTNNSRALVLNVGFLPRTLLVNEILYAPPTGMPEWIEVVNNSADTIPISGWKISDATTNRAAINPSNRSILPSSYCVITTDTAALKLFFAIPSPLFQASFSALNNTGDAVVLFDPANSVIDSLTFTSAWGGSSGGRSLERIDTAIASALQNNWRTSINPSGATPGVINSVTQKPFDAMVSRISASPQFPRIGDPITVTPIIKNNGKQNITSITVRVYLDANKDSILSAGELQSEQSIAFLTAGDSVSLPVTLPSLSQGTHWFFTKIHSVQDEDTTNNSFFFPLSVGIPQRSIVINEIMYAPLGDMPEWVEGYNTTSSPVSISGWKISDNGTTKAQILNAQPVVPPHSHFVITSDTNQFKSIFPTVSFLFHAAMPALNNTTPDAVVLFDERSAMMDSVFYKQSWGGINGNSLQRYDYFGSSVDSSNWRSGMPSAGNENIVARKEFDVEVKRFSYAKNGHGFALRAVIFNAGRETAQAMTVLFYHDANNDGTGQQNEILYSNPLAALAPLDSSAVEFQWNQTSQGKQQILVSVEFSSDERPQNNSGSMIVKNSYPFQTIVINEVMYEPLSGNAEFVELLNRSPDTVDVGEWKLMDQPGSTGSRANIMLAKTSLRIPPGGYIVVAGDSSIFFQYPLLIGKNVIIYSSLSLNNTGEDLVLVDLTDMQIDSVRYSPSWHLKSISPSGRSLERIDPNGNSNDSRNWSSSVSRMSASPGEKNSIFIGSVAETSSLLLSPNPFSPDNDGHQDFLSINYLLPVNSATIRVRIFDVTGRLVRRLVQSEPTPSAGSIIWNGLDDDGHRVRIGMYIILFEAFDNFGGTVKTMKDVAVVARKL